MKKTYHNKFCKKFVQMEFTVESMQNEKAKIQPVQCLCVVYRLLDMFGNKEKEIVSSLHYIITCDLYS